VSAERRRGAPRITTLLGIVLLVAAAFLAGTEAQKEWGGNDGGGRERAFFPGRSFGSDRVTNGTVTQVEGRTLYVGTDNGGVVRVEVPTSAEVTKAVTTSILLSRIHRGDHVTAVGHARSDGVVEANAVEVLG
jgi:hypothetical protein